MKLSVTYRASLDRHVPIVVRAELPRWMGGTRPVARSQKMLRSFFFVRERLRVS